MRVTCSSTERTISPVPTNSCHWASTSPLSSVPSDDSRETNDVASV
jgi:hypothetical protein